MKIEKLTPEQEQLMYEVRDEWINRLHKCETVLNEEEATKGVHFLYSLAGLKLPEVRFVDSPMACQNLANEMNGTNEYYQFSSNGNISDYGWVALYDFFQRIGIEMGENFNKMMNLLKSGVYDMLQFENICIVSKMPVKVRTNADGRLHSTETFAIEWSDGYGQYHINGRSMPESIFKGFTKEEFISEQNEDIKAGMYEIIEAKGEGYMLSFLGAEIVDKKTFVHLNGEMEEMELYKTKEFFAEEEDLNGRSPAPLAWLKMSCPSTGRVYLIPSDGSFNNCEDAAKYHRPNEVDPNIDYAWHSRN